MARLIKVAAVLVAVLVAGAVLVPTVLTRSAAGRDWVRAQAEQRLTGLLEGRGRVAIGKVARLSPTAATLRDVVLRDRWGLPIAQVGEAEVAIDLGALTRRVIHFRHLVVRDVTLDITQRFDSVWNVVSLLPDSSGPRRLVPGWGDDVYADSVRIERARARVAMLWAPHPTFRGRERDSVTAVYRTLHDVRDTADRMIVTRRWDRLDAVLRDAHFTRPAGGGRVQLAALRSGMSDPPMPIRAARGVLEWTPAKRLLVDLPEVVLGASRGAATGSVSWADAGPVRYDLVVSAPDVALADINWVWPALPTTGRGRARLAIRSQRDADRVDYFLDSLAVEAMGSDVQGRVNVLVTPRTIALSRMRLAFAPLTMPVIRRLVDGELPAALDGDVRGRVVAETGGPLSGVRLDSADFTYRARDGQLARLTMAGIVGSGAAVTTEQLRVQRLEIPLALMRPLVPTWPDGITGTVQARTQLDADLATGRVNARDLVVEWRTADGRRATLQGRVAGRDLLGARGAIDVELTSDYLDPLVAGALADSLPLRVPLAGRLAARGPLDALTIDASVRPAQGSGELAWVGQLDRSTRGIRVGGTLTARSLDVRALTGLTTLPRTALGGSIELNARATRPAPTAPWQVDSASANGVIAQHDSTGLLPAQLTLDAWLDAQALTVRQAELRVPSARVGAVGMLRRDTLAPPGAWRPRVVTAEGDTVVGDTVQIALRIDSLARLAADVRRVANALPVGDSLRTTLESWPDSLAGDAFASLRVTGALSAPRALLALNARHVQAGALTIGDLAVEGNGAWPLAGAVRVEARELRQGALALARVALDADSISAGGARLRLAALGATSPDVRAEARVRVSGDSTIAEWRSLRAEGAGARLDLLAPTRLIATRDRVVLDSTRFGATNGGRLTIAGTLPTTGAITGVLDARHLPLSDLGALLEPPRRLAGTLDARLALAGTRDAPMLDWYVRGDSLGADSVAIAGIEGDGSYADRELLGSLLIDVRPPANGVARPPTTALRASFAVPVDLALRPRDARLLDRPLAARLDIDSLALADLPWPQGTVRDVAGTADGHVLVAGTPTAPRLEGALSIARGALTAEAAGLELRDIALAARGAGREVTIERLRATSGGNGDSLSLRGAVRLGDGGSDRGRIDVRGVFRNFAVLRRGDLADLDLAGTLEASGTLDSVVVAADLSIPRGTIYRDAVESRTAIDLSSTEALELLGADAPAVRSSTALDLEGVARRIRGSAIRIRAGDELWVRAPTVAAKVGGEVTLVVDRGSLVPRGELTAQRGLYRLDLGVVRRTFDVDSGRVRFFGQSSIAPTVDVYASHDVRQASGGEVTVRAHIGGTLERPTLALSTDDAVGGRVPDTEVISLLLFGAPTFALDGTSQSTVQSVTSVLLPSVGGLVEGALGRLLPVFNTVQLTTAGGRDQPANRFDLLNNVSLSAGKQIGDRTFIRLNSGICRGTADAARDLTPWLGLAVEYRLSAALSVQASADPGTAPCSRVGTDALSRLQFGFDLFRNWIF